MTNNSPRMMGNNKCVRKFPNKLPRTLVIKYSNKKNRTGRRTYNLWFQRRTLHHFATPPGNADCLVDRWLSKNQSEQTFQHCIAFGSIEFTLVNLSLKLTFVTTTSRPILFEHDCTINSQNFMKIVVAVFEKIKILNFLYVNYP